MAKTRNQRGNTPRHQPKHGRAASGIPLENIGKEKKALTPRQRQAIEALELGQRYEGRSFKRHKNPGDKPSVKRRPPMPNESIRTDMDRHGDAMM